MNNENRIVDMIKTPELAELRQKLDGMNIVDIANELGLMSRQDAIIAFRILAKDKAAEVFAYLDTDNQQDIIEAIDEKEIGGIVDELFLDDAVDFIEEMPANVVKRVLANVTPDTRRLINGFLQYPKDSAGSIMTIEYVDLKSNMTVADAFAHIRNTGIDKETIYTCYVTDDERRLIGLVTARTLFLSGKDILVKEIMEPNVIYSNTHDDREELIDNFRKYGFIAIPVVDNEKRLVGIVTFDDALQIQEEEATEDFEKMAAMSPSEKPYLKTGILSLSKNRIPWLFLLNLSVFITGAVIKNFEDALAVLPILVTFIPMLMDTSGDAGSQSSTLIIRGMALGEIKVSNFFAVLWKELRVAVICGSILAALNFARVIVFNNSFGLALATSLALLTATVLAKTMGAILPIGAKIIKLDPAVMAGPILTTIVDAATLMVYFSLAMLILSI